MRKKTNDDSLTSGRVKRGHAVLLGYGLDNEDGHIRYTRGSAFELYGGSDSAHGEMQKRALLIQEEIAKLGISLDGMTYEQYQLVRGIVERVGCE